MRRGLLILGFVGLLTVAGGCYERVVASKGLGSDSIQPTYRSNTAADRAYDSMFGTPPKTYKNANNMPVTGKSTWIPRDPESSTYK